jgi:prostaglandin-endoperoxide synthase 2
MFEASVFEKIRNRTSVDRFRSGGRLVRLIDRLCRLDSYANYRAYVGLNKPTKFSDVSKNKDVVDFLAEHYKNPEDIDYYIGLFSEDTTKNSPLPPLILRMVAVDAFSQALTNPLLSEHVYNAETFTEMGWDTINRAGSLRDLLVRNSRGGRKIGRISLTQSSWKYSW